MAGIPIIQGFEVSKAAPIDARFVVASAAERTSIYWVYAGLLVYQTDNNTLYKYNGTTWDTLGAIGPDGDPGSVWYNGAGVPANGTGIDGDYYLRTTTGDVYQKAAGVWGSVLLNIMGPTGPSGIGPGDFAQLHVTGGATAQSLTTSYALFTGFTTNGAAAGATPDAATDKITINNAGKYTVFFSADVLGIVNKQYQFVVYVDGVASDVTFTFDTTSNSTPAVTFFGVIDVVSVPVSIEIYAKCISGTNNLTIITGTWGVAGLNVKGDAGIAGKALIHTAADVTLTEAIISSVEAGSYTPQNPYAASILADNRVNISAPSAISGNKTGHSISYNGTVWSSNGIWRGPAGATGATGAQGSAGVSPTNHFQVIQDTVVGGTATNFTSTYTFAATLNPSGTINQWTNNTGKTVTVRIMLKARARRTAASNVLALLTLTAFINGVSTKTDQGSVGLIGDLDFYSNIQAEVAVQVLAGQTLGWRGQITHDGSLLAIIINTQAMSVPRWLVHIIV